MCQIQNYTLFDFVCLCLYIYICMCVCFVDLFILTFLLAQEPFVFQQCVGSFAGMEVHDTHLVHMRTHFHICSRTCIDSGCGSVIIQRGKQPAPDLISCLGSNREVGKYYQLITVLPASPSFSSYTLAKRKLGFSLCFV